MRALMAVIRGPPVVIGCRGPDVVVCSVLKVRDPLPFFQVDDQLPQSRKSRQLVEPVLDGNIEGLAAIGLWTLAGAQSQVLGGGTNGLVSRADLVRVILNPQVAQQLADRLVAVGFWHQPGHGCSRCPAVPPGHWYFHDWSAMKYTDAAQASMNKAKRQELKDPLLIAQVWARDCIDPDNPTIGRCRYCGEVVKRKDTRSDRQPQLDHVDPRKAAGITNVVLSCRPCNRNKGNRTPREADMTLLPPPRPPLAEVSHGDGEPASGPRDAAQARVGSSHTPGPPPRAPQAPGFADHSATQPPVPDSGIREGRMPVERVDGDGRPPEDQILRERPAPSTHTGTRPPPDQTPTKRKPPLVPPQNQGGFEVPAGRGPGQGQGRGQGLGSGVGSPTGFPQPATSRDSSSRSSRRRRRRKSRSPQDQPAPEIDSLDAGLPPPGVQPPAGGQGSPWHGWHGPPSFDTETNCPTHHQPEPCQRCGREQETECP